MKPFLLALALVALAACDTADPLPTLSAEADAAARDDAAVLVLRDQLASADSLTVEIRPAQVQQTYEAIVRVRASEKGGLVEGVRALPRFVLRDLIVGTPPGTPWTAAWARGETTTGYAPVDALAGTYGLTLSDFQAYSNIESTLLRTEAPRNMVAIARRFASVDGIRYAEANAVGTVGFGIADITATRAGRALVLGFRPGAPDCFSDCSTFTFRVTGDRVEYLGER